MNAAADKTAAIFVCFFIVSFSPFDMKSCSCPAGQKLVDRTDRQQLLRSCRTVVFVYRLIITVCDDGIPVWVPGISGTPWKAFHGMENAEN